MALSLGASWAPIVGLLMRRTPTMASNAPALIPFGVWHAASPTTGLPAVSIGLSAWLADAWEGLLRAVPKKKTSHMKRRHRQLAGKALKDLKNINTCPGCGKPKKSHTLCPYCVSEIQSGWRDADIAAKEAAKQAAKATPANEVVSACQLREQRQKTQGYAAAEARGEVDKRRQVAAYRHQELGKVEREAVAMPEATKLQMSGHKSEMTLICTVLTAVVHLTDIYSLALTPTAILSGSGDASIKIYSTTADGFPIAQVLKDAHRLGCHHISTSQTGDRAVSVGFGGEAKIWKFAESIWQQDGEIAAAKSTGELWAVCLSVDGQYLAGTTHDGRVNVWDLLNSCEKIREYETKGSFGMCIDLSPDGRFTASGHESGNIYVFSTATSRLLHSLPGLVKPVRSVKFSPGSKLVAAAGDARIIGLYDSNSGEQVAHLTGHAAWITSLDWSHTGQYLLSGSLDGKVKVWDIERRTCVATHSESDKGLWTVKWLPKGDNAVEQRKAERFVTAGSNKAISIYREASGG
ncbi:hypothetical protein DV736_g4111, partial [Chaetothyriales sp. CBS 134916]